MKLSDNLLGSMRGRNRRGAGILCLSFVMMAIASIAGAVWGHFQKITPAPGVCSTQQPAPNAIFREPCPGCGMG